MLAVVATSCGGDTLCQFQTKGFEKDKFCHCAAHVKGVPLVRSSSLLSVRMVPL